MKIVSVHARQILDSRGNPTIEADITLEDKTVGRAAVPSGASTGAHEAIELRDGDKTKYNGTGVLQAVKNVSNEIAQAIIGMEVTDQEGIDKKLIDLDGTENKSRLGANAILSVSLGVAHAAANQLHLPLYRYLSTLEKRHSGEYRRSGMTPESKEDAGQASMTKKSQDDNEEIAFILPVPMMNIINGGRHANWATDIQEYLIFPIGAQTFNQALQMGTEIFHALGKVLKDKGYSTLVGDEGGYAPSLQHGNAEPFELISQAVQSAGYKLGIDIAFGIDAASSEFFKEGKYHLRAEGKELTSDEMIEWVSDLAGKYPLISLEDCLDQNDWAGWTKLTQRLGEKIQIIGDDLFVTNTKFIQKGIDEKSANAVLIKVNQIGTLTETIAAVHLARSAGFNSIISHRSGETEDTTIAHLAVALGTGQIKTGSLCRTERVAKYNELLRIEEQLGPNAKFDTSLRATSYHPE